MLKGTVSIISSDSVFKEGAYSIHIGHTKLSKWGRSNTPMIGRVLQKVWPRHQSWNWASIGWTSSCRASLRPVQGVGPVRIQNDPSPPCGIFRNINLIYNVFLVWTVLTVNFINLSIAKEGKPERKINSFQKQKPG